MSKKKLWIITVEIQFSAEDESEVESKTRHELDKVDIMYRLGKVKMVKENEGA